MNRYFALTFATFGLAAPAAAQDLTGTWIGDAPAAGGKGALKVELKVAKSGKDYAVEGILYKEGKQFTTFTGKNIKAAGPKAITMTEEFAQTPPEWSAKPTKVTLKIFAGSLHYDREFSKKQRTFAHLKQKTPELFAQLLNPKKEAPAAAVKEPPSTKNTASWAPIPSDDPNVLMNGGLMGEVVFTADGKTLISSAGDSVIRFFDFATHKQRFSIVADKGLGPIAITPDASLIAGGLGKSIVIWDAEGKELMRLGEHMYGVASLAFSPDGKTLISTDDGSTTADRADGTTKIWDIDSGKELVNIPYCGKGTLAYLPKIERFVFLNGRYVKNSANPLNAYTNFYKVYDTKGKMLYEKASNHQIVRQAVVSPDQKLVLTACLTGNINLLNVASGKIERTLKCKALTYIQSVAFTPDGKRFAVGGGSGQVAIFETATGKELSSSRPYPAELRRLAISPDGQWLVAGGYGTQMTITKMPE